MSARVSANTIAEALGQTKRNINDRADRECWVHSWSRAQGGRQKVYPVLPLPLDVRTRVLALLAKEAVTAARAEAKVTLAKIKTTLPIDPNAAAASRELGLAKFATIPDASKRRADARAALVEIAANYVKISGMARSRSENQFCNEYSAGRIELPEWVRDEVPNCCPNSLYNWRSKVKAQGLVGLAGKYGQHRKGCGIIDTTPELREFILAMIHEFPHCEPSLVMAGIRGRFDPVMQPSYRTLQRWIQQWKAENEQLLVRLQNPDAWRNQFMSAFGFADANIIRLNQRWETDSTKADLMLWDKARQIKTRHNIVGVIDVYSRRTKFYVSRSSSATAVASLLRTTILDWGVPEVLGTDNGSDFVSHYIKRVVSGLDIRQDVAPPFTPDHKPFIERVFRTFSHSLLEALPGFIGHNVVERKGIESRRSFAERLMRKEKGDAAIELHMTPEELQAFCDSWVENHYHQNGHSGLKGETPFQRAAAWQEPVRRIMDVRALDVLLAPAPGSGSAGGEGKYIVGKKGIRFNNSFYGDMGGIIGTLMGQEVRVLLDESDIGRIFVFKVSTGEFVCVAECPELTGIFNRQEMAVAMKASQRQKNKEDGREIRRIARKANVRDIAHQTLIERATEAGKMVMFPAPAVEHTTEALREAGIAAGHLGDTVPSRVHACESALPAHPAQIINFHPVRDAAQVEMEAKETRFARWKDIDARLKAGLEVSDADRRWHKGYSRDAECTSRVRGERMIAEGRIAG